MSNIFWDWLSGLGASLTLAGVVYGMLKWAQRKERESIKRVYEREYRRKEKADEISSRVDGMSDADLEARARTLANRLRGNKL